MLNPDDLPKPLKLDIGAGADPVEGTLSVDLFTGADIVATMWDIPLPDGCVDEIYSRNSLEHIGKNDVVPTLREWHRLLKSGGSLNLLIPDLEWALQYWLKYQGTGWPLDIIYGNQMHEGEYHKTGFTPRIIWNYLVASAQGGWNVETIEFIGGEETATPLDEGGYHVDALQRLIVVKAFKV